MKCLQFSLALCSVMLFAAAASAASIGVNFGSDNAGGGNPSLGAADTAGVVSQANWNNAGGTAGSVTDAVDDSGAATTADVDWSADESWSYNVALGSTDAQLMSGWISENGGDASTVSISEIPYAAYDLYIYAGHDRVDNTPHFTETSAAFPAFSITEDVTDVTLAANPFVYNLSSGGGAGNYVKVSGLTASALNIELTNPNNDRAGWAGLQIVEVPEPASILLGLSAAIFGLVSRRRN